jgi:uncharacterized YccA/Bax inhibitor family protein
MMRTANPALNKKTFREFAVAAEHAMTIQGTATKTLVLLLVLMITASWMWKRASAGLATGDMSGVMPWMYGGGIGGFVVALVTVFKKRWAPVTAPLYAALEGILLGALSMFFEARFPGIVVQAVALTFGTLFAMLMAYKSRLIRATENFKLGLFAATGAVMLIYLASFALGFLGIEIPYIHESGLIGIGFSLAVVVIAALNLVLDFDFIENGADAGAPKYMEWYGAFGLIVTLVWLYIEFLRLLSKIRSR